MAWIYFFPDDFEYDLPEYSKFKSGSTTGLPNVDEGDLVSVIASNGYGKIPDSFRIDTINSNC